MRGVLRRSEELGSEEEGAGRGEQVAKSKGRREGQKEGAGRVREPEGSVWLRVLGRSDCSWRGTVRGQAAGVWEPGF